MINEPTLSKYKNYVTASRKSVFLANFADYLLSFILTFILFSIAGSPIFGALPSTQHNLSEASLHVKRYYKIVDDTRLQRYDEANNSLSSVDDDAKRYIVSLTKTSFYLNDEPYPYEDGSGGYIDKAVPFEETLLFDDAGDYPNENLAYYFFTFKSNHPSIDFYSYDGVDYVSNKEEYLYQKAFGYSVDLFESKREDVTIYRQLKKEKADLLMHYLVYGDGSDAPYQTYRSLAASYIKACNLFVDEVQTHYDAFIQENADFDRVIAEYDLGLMIDLSICYFASILILEGVLPLFLKEGRTIGARALKCSYATKADLTPHPIRFFIKSSARLVLYYSSIFFILIILGSTSMAFISYGWFSFSILFVATGLLAIGSLVLEMIFSSRQGIPELLSGLVLKDTTQMEAGVPLEEGGAK